jgi:hypothetical protein
MTIPINQLPNVTALNYLKLRPGIRSGDILLCSGSSVFSNLIQQVTQSIWSHVAFILRIDAIDRIMVLESVESIGVRAVALSSYVNNYNGSGKPYPGKMLIARHSAFNDEKVPNLSREAVDLLGYPYDKNEIVRIAARISLRSANTLPTINLGQDHAFICSEYAAMCFQSVGIEIHKENGGWISPADFAATPEISAINLLAPA